MNLTRSGLVIGRRTCLRTLALFGILLAVAAGFLPSGAAGVTGTFRNPIAPLLPGSVPGYVGLDSPDPWIFTFHGRYYLTNSAGSQIVLRSASELGGLASAPLRLLWPRSQVTPAPAECCEFWAPEIHRLRQPEGWRWFIYSAADDGDLLHHHLQVLESLRDDPAGPYRFRGILGLGPDYEIDPTVFVLRGREYVIYSDAPATSFFPTHLALAPLRNPWTVAGSPVTISSPTYPWENTGFAINEGPEVLRHGPWLHVIYSAGWCALSTYSLARLTVPASANVLDPRTWLAAKAPQPVFTSDPAHDVWGTGHGSFFKSPDGRQDWQVYHATDNPVFGCFNGFRTTRAQRFTWNRDGTLNFGRPVSLGTDLAAPSGDPTIERQLENASLVDSSGARSLSIPDPNFVGEAGVLIVTGRAFGSVTYAVDVPAAARYHVLVRLGTGPDRHAIGLTVSSRHHTWRLASRDAHASVAGVSEADFGPALLPSGFLRFRFTLPAPGVATLAQIRLLR